MTQAVVASRRARRVGATTAAGTLGPVAITAAVTLAAFVVAVMVGPAGPSWWRVPLALVERFPGVDFDAGVSDAEWAIVWRIRMPRVVLGALVGGMLSLAGASYQGVFRNPLVDPYQLGAAAGAGLGATLALTTLRAFTRSWPIEPAPALAFVFAVGAVAVTYVVGSAWGGDRSGIRLVLAGVAVVAFVTAIQTFILQRNLEVVTEVYSWILGRLSGARWARVGQILPYVAVCAAVLVVHGRQLDTLRVGDDEAASLGVSVRRVRLVVVVFATLGTAAVVSVSGLIGFVGLIVPHAIRRMFGASYRLVLPLSMLGGATFLMLADIPGRVLTKPAEIPIGVVTAFFGAPFFLVLLRSKAARP